MTAKQPSQPLNLWLRTREGSPARQIANEVQIALEAAEKRTRRRKARDAATFAALIDMLVANVLHATMTAHCQSQVQDAWLNYTRTHRAPSRDSQNSSVLPARYRRSPFPLNSLPSVIDAMEQLSLLYSDIAPRFKSTTATQSKGYRPSRIRVRPKLMRLSDDAGVTLADFTEIAGNEVIWLRDALQNTLAGGHDWSEVTERGPVLGYRDTDQTNTWRRQVIALNDWLAKADISLGSVDGIALHQRRLRRIFNNGRFDHGGRLAGGFWLNMPKELRAGLRIDGKPLASLDFSSMFLSLLYALYAKSDRPADADLYLGIICDSWPEDPATKTVWREVIKRNVNALLFCDGPRTRVVQGTRPILDAAPGTRKMPVDELDKRIQQRHVAIAPWLGSTIGYELYFHESEIMMAILGMCLGHGIVALPLHDGILVREDQAAQAKRIMEFAFFRATGFNARVDGPRSADGALDTMAAPGSEDETLRARLG